MNPLLITGIFFLFIFIFGFWVRRAGKPYNALLFNLHKLIGLAAGIYLIREIYLAHQSAALNVLDFSVIALTGVIFILLVAAGGLLSAAAEGNLRNLPPAALEAITTVHHILPYLAVVLTATVLYLVWR